MKIFAQNNQRPSQVLFAFDDIAIPQVEQIRWAVAYSTRAGCDRLVNRVKGRMGQAQWVASEKHFITSLDFGLTEPRALEFLQELPGSTVRIANPQVVYRAGFRPTYAYHPKVYLFDRADTTGFVVGSANLTNSALMTNAEVVVAGWETPDNNCWSTVWDDLVACTELLTDGLLADYAREWQRPQPRPVEPDLDLAVPTVSAIGRTVFYEAVDAGTVSPIAFDHFWVEAGSMSSGGSHNQLELPRAANLFFGFNHANYGDGHVVIGHPVLTLRGQTWNDRPLTWHGNNRMERINLPTLAQGGFDYQHTAILFRRHASGFEIDVLPWNDDVAIAWRSASASLATVYKLGERGRRICGLF